MVGPCTVAPKYNIQLIKPNTIFASILDMKLKKNKKKKKMSFKILELNSQKINKIHSRLK